MVQPRQTPAPLSGNEITVCTLPLHSAQGSAAHPNPKRLASHASLPAQPSRPWLPRKCSRQAGRQAGHSNYTAYVTPAAVT